MHRFVRRLVSTCAAGLAVCLLGSTTSATAAGSDRATHPQIAPTPADVATMAAVRLESGTADGAWESVPVTAGFLQREPREGADASQRTDVQVRFTETHLLVRVRAWDTESGKIVAIRTRRDLSSPSDWIRVFIDSYHDRKTAYEFAVNPAGVKSDTYWFNDSNTDTSWDAVWDVTVSTDARGWTAVFRIPFSQLRFDPSRTDTFGFGVMREIARIRESSTWPAIAKSQPGFVSQLGHLTGVRPGRNVKRIEVVPYAVSQVSSAPNPDGNPFISSRDPGGAFGADLKYALTPGLTVTATVNPDFGQVEADPAVVNLSAFETFYEERRPFFVEGSGNLTFNLDCNDGECTGLFYSRRIGRTPHGSPDAPDAGFVSFPSQTTILGAAKLTGRVGAFAVGALTAVTGHEHATLADGAARSREMVEPVTGYTLAQARREWPNRSSVALMLTHTTRSLPANLSWLPSNATAAGLNWDWRLKPNYAMRGYVAGSSVRGSTDAIAELQQNAVHNFQRPDARHIEFDQDQTALNGHAGSVSFERIGGKRVRFSFAGTYKSPGFDVNDLGYQRRADEMGASGWVQFRWETPTKLYRSVRVNLNQWAGWNYDGLPRYAGTNVNVHVTLTSNWTLGAGSTAEGRGWDDRTTRGGPAFRTKRGTNVWYYLGTDSRKAVSAMWQAYAWRDESGSSSHGFDPELTWRLTSFCTLSTGVHYERVNEGTQWVDRVDGATPTYVFGRMRQTTVGMTGRLNLTLSPTLSLQLYGQPFVSAGSYSDFRALTQPGARTIAEQFSGTSYDGSPDFNYKSFRTTNVLRWEFRPGSALFAVWQQGREDSSSAAYGGRRDLSRVFSLPSSNVFLLKASYWFNF